MVAPALRALLERSIDYAGTFPPASLPCVAAVANFQSYRQHEHAWMLRWLVLDQKDLGTTPADLDNKLSVVGNADEPRAAALETKALVQAARPAYCEVPIDRLDEVKAAGLFAKIRTGGVTAAMIPSVEAVADFIHSCAERRLPFKATAGLHHPIRAEQPLTYEPNPPRAVMHGFLNVLLAAAFAWHGRRDITPVIAETDPTAFRFDDRGYWRDDSLTGAEIAAARADFIHAFGSCSFDEPVHDLKALGFL